MTSLARSTPSQTTWTTWGSCVELWHGAYSSYPHHSYSWQTILTLLSPSYMAVRKHMRLRGAILLENLRYSAKKTIPMAFLQAILSNPYSNYNFKTAQVKPLGTKAGRLLPKSVPVSKTSASQTELWQALLSLFCHPPTRTSIFEPLQGYLGCWNLVRKLYSTELGPTFYFLYLLEDNHY